MSTYKFNSTDPEITWGLHFGPSLDEQLLAAPKKKDNGLTINWAGENGTERYHGIKSFESKIYNIDCTLIASSKSDFLTKWGLFQTFLLTQGEFEFTVLRLSRKWKVSYLDMSKPVKLGSFEAGGNVAFQFTLQLVDDYPTDVFSA